MKRFAFSSLAFALLSVASHAASVTVSAPPSVSGSFDVAVDATNVFANFPDPTDGLIAFGFNVDVGSPLITFTGSHREFDLFSRHIRLLCGHRRRGPG